MLSNSDVDCLIGSACDDNGVPDLFNKIEWEWSNRMTAAAGKCIIKHIGDRRIIRLSKKLLGIATEMQRINTVTHETCHHIEWELRRKLSHSAYWKRLMRTAGIENPSPYCNIVGAEQFQTNRVPITCNNCGMVYHIGKRKLTNALRRGYFSCKCGERLT